MKPILTLCLVLVAFAAALTSANPAAALDGPNGPPGGAAVATTNVNCGYSKYLANTGPGPNGQGPADGKGLAVSGTSATNPPDSDLVIATERHNFKSRYHCQTCQYPSCTKESLANTGVVTVARDYDYGSSVRWKWNSQPTSTLVIGFECTDCTP